MPGGSTPARSCLAFWLAREGLRRPAPRRLVLVAARSKAHWEAMVGYREKVEKGFAGYAPGIARRAISQIRHRNRHLAGDWYLALADGVAVGGIGLLVFDTPAGRVGRLQDVDVAPAFRGRGLGRELLYAVCRKAADGDLAGLCLRADADDWPRDWYRRFGFVRVGTWPYYEQPARGGGGRVTRRVGDPPAPPR